MAGWISDASSGLFYILVPAETKLNLTVSKKNIIFSCTPAGSEVDKVKLRALLKEELSQPFGCTAEALT